MRRRHNRLYAYEYLQGMDLIFFGYVRAAVIVNSNLNEPTGHGIATPCPLRLE